MEKGWRCLIHFRFVHLFFFFFFFLHVQLLMLSQLVDVITSSTWIVFYSVLGFHTLTLCICFPSKKGDMDGVGSHVWNKWDKESFSLSPWIQQCDFRRTKSSNQKVFFARQVTGCVVHFSTDNPFCYMIFGMIKTTKALFNRFWLYASDFHTRVKVGTERNFVFSQ